MYPPRHHNQQQTQIDALIAAIAKLPALGPRSARRIVLHLLRKKETVMLPLLQQMQDLAEEVKHCSICRNLDVSDPCHICADNTRIAGQICVVQDVADVWALERSRLFHGRYHVLGGMLSALDGKDPESLGVPLLLRRIAEEHISEVILALNATADGQTTSHYLIDALSGIAGLRITKLAQGIPVGGELDYLDDGTLGTAFQARMVV